jgi:putative glutamine amidotransferase
VGVAGRKVPFKWWGRDMHSTSIWQQYMDLLAAVGCVPVVLPLQPGVEHVIGKLDGLVLPGGPDVDPARYGAELHAETVGVNPAADDAEVALLDAAFGAGLPFLGICRGMQIFNVSQGGTLHQYLPDVAGNSSHQPQVGVMGEQLLQLKPGSHIAEAFGDDTPNVRCHHHQAVAELGAGLETTAWTADGVIEAIEATDYPFAVGVQWHPDLLEDLRPFRVFADAVRRVAAEGGSAGRRSEQLV